MKSAGIWLTLAVVAVILCGADAPGETTDFRGKVTLAYGLLFVLVILYLAVSQRKNAGLKEELEFLQRRLAEVEKKGP